MEVRSAGLEDAPAIGVAHAEAWRAAFSEFFAAGWLDGAIQERRLRWSESLHDCMAGGAEVLVAETLEGVVGFVHFGPSEQGASVGEVFALYVHPDHWGSGAAQLLSQHATKRLSAKGFERIVLWTLARAGRARGFYDHNGWIPTGRTAAHDFGEGGHQEVVEYLLESTGSPQG